MAAFRMEEHADLLISTIFEAINDLLRTEYRHHKCFRLSMGHDMRRYVAPQDFMKYDMIKLVSTSRLVANAIVKSPSASHGSSNGVLDIDFWPGRIRLKPYFYVSIPDLSPLGHIIPIAMKTIYIDQHNWFEDIMGEARKSIDGYQAFYKSLQNQWKELKARNK